MNEMLLSPKAIQLMGRIVHRLARRYHSHVPLTGKGGEALVRVLRASEHIGDKDVQVMRSELLQEIH